MPTTILEMPPTIFETDSTAAISLATNEQVSGRNKNINIKIHHVKDLLSSGILQLQYVSSSENIADILTKSTHPDVLQYLSKKAHLY